VLDAGAWSLVSGSGIGSPLDFTLFQTALIKRVPLSPGRSRIVHFAFNVPSTVRENAFICAQANVSQGRVQPYFNTVAHSDLFCIFKTSSAATFSVVTGKDAQRLIRRANGPTVTSPKGK
jgi:hypothetical protein